MDTAGNAAANGLGWPEWVAMNTLTPLEYFAAHAPSVPADWFEPVFTPIKIPPKPEGAEWCDGCKAGADCDKTEACAQMKAWWDDKETREDCNEHALHHARASQWPWAWAKMVLEENPATKTGPRIWTPEIAEELLVACKEQHTAMDWLFARLIEKDPKFFPSQSFAWTAAQHASDAIRKAEGVEIRA